jgi:dTMP kinase
VFITLEGPEGGGKTTQAAMLTEALRALGREVVRTREPGGVEAAEALRELVLHHALQRETEALLFLAARAEHARAVIAPALAEGKIVVCDRFNDSTLAYQGHGLGLDLEALRAMCAFAACGLTPDLTLLLDLPVEAGLRRRFATAQLELGMDLPEPTTPERTINKMENRDLDFHRRVREGFLLEAAGAPDRFLVLDATRPIAKVHEAILAETLRRLPGPRDAGPPD